jgi:uncharacterized membrane protein
LKITSGARLCGLDCSSFWIVTVGSGILDEQSKPQSLAPDVIFKAKQDLREDDKEIINFLSANGGQAYESELRKKFLQPRTTMWRAVKRGIIEIEKKDLQNIVRLKSKLGDA